MRRLIRGLLLSITVGLVATLFVAALGFHVDRHGIWWDYERMSEWRDGPMDSIWRHIGWVELPDGRIQEFDWVGSGEESLTEREITSLIQSAVIAKRPQHSEFYREAYRGWPFAWLRVYQTHPYTDHMLLKSQLAAQFRIRPGLFVVGVKWARLIGCVGVFSACIGLLLAPAGPTRRWFIKRRRRRSGQCQACGYSLYGASGSYCPECGSEATAGA